MLATQRRLLWSAARLGQMPLLWRIMPGWSGASLASRAQFWRASAETASGGLPSTTLRLTGTLFALRRVHISGGDEAIVLLLSFILSRTKE